MKSEWKTTLNIFLALARSHGNNSRDKSRDNFAYFKNHARNEISKLFYNIFLNSNHYSKKFNLFHAEDETFLYHFYQKWKIVTQKSVVGNFRLEINYFVPV